eukprot:scaffold5766_cov110-Isochrysis_galbana.AAC.3
MSASAGPDCSSCSGRGLLGRNLRTAGRRSGPTNSARAACKRRGLLGPAPAWLRARGRAWPSARPLLPPAWRASRHVAAPAVPVGPSCCALFVVASGVYCIFGWCVEFFSRFGVEMGGRVHNGEEDAVANVSVIVPTCDMSSLLWRRMSLSAYLLAAHGIVVEAWMLCCRIRGFLHLLSLIRCG